MTNLLPKKEDMTTKMLFKFSDIVAMSALMNEFLTVLLCSLIQCFVSFLSLGVVNIASLQSQVDGIYANHALLTIINDLVGKEVLVEAVDGAKYSGIFTACSPEKLPPSFLFYLSYLEAEFSAVSP
ncbi:hypothetical protein COOONC_02900 [Cooperia oncophora]